MVFSVSGLSQDTLKVNENENKNHGAITFDEALTLTNFGKFNYFFILIAGMVMGNALLETAGMGFILPIAQCDLQLTTQNKGVLSAIGYLGIITSSHLWGFLADTKGRLRTIRPTLLAGFIVTVFSSFSHKFWMMVFLRFLNGFFISASSATIYAYLGEFHSDKTRSRAMMGSSCIFSFTALILPVIAFLVINKDWALPISFLGIVYKPWRLFLIVCGMPGLLCGLLLFAIPESPKFLLSIGKEEKAIEVLQKIHRWNGGQEELKISHILPDDDEIDVVGKTSSNMVIHFLQTMWRQTVPLFRGKYLRITLITCNIQFWVFTVANGMYMWFPYIINNLVEFMNKHPGENMCICQIIFEKEVDLYKDNGTVKCITKLEDTTYFYSMIMEILYVCAFVVIGFVINRFGKIVILFFTFTFFPACGLVSVFIANPSIAAYLYVVFMTAALAPNILGAAIVELYPTNLSAMAIGISMMVGRVGGVISANIIGTLLSHNCELIFCIIIGALFICAFLCLLIPRKSLDKSFPPSSIEATN